MLTVPLSRWTTLACASSEICVFVPIMAHVALTECILSGSISCLDYVRYYVLGYVRFMPRLCASASLEICVYVHIWPTLHSRSMFYQILFHARTVCVAVLGSFNALKIGQKSFRNIGFFNKSTETSQTSDSDDINNVFPNPVPTPLKSPELSTSTRDARASASASSFVLPDTVQTSHSLDDLDKYLRSLDETTDSCTFRISLPRCSSTYFTSFIVTTSLVLPNLFPI